MAALDNTVFSIMPVNPKKKLCSPNKVIVLGSSGAGKTTLVHHLASKHASSSSDDLATSATLMGDYLERVALVGATASQTTQTQQLVKVQLWDTAGQGKFGAAAALPKAYFRHARGAILVYSATSRRSFDELVSTWVTPLEELYCGRTFSLTLVATHCDRASERQVSTAQGEWLAARLGADHFAECSLDSASAYDECFHTIASGIAAEKTWTIAETTVSTTLDQLRAIKKVVAPAAIAETVTATVTPATMTAAHIVVLTLAVDARKIQSAHAASSDATSTLSASSFASTWSHLLQLHSIERKVLVGTTALMLAMPSALESLVVVA